MVAMMAACANPVTPPAISPTQNDPRPSSNPDAALRARFAMGLGWVGLPDCDSHRRLCRCCLGTASSWSGGTGDCGRLLTTEGSPLSPLDIYWTRKQATSAGLGHELEIGSCLGRVRSTPRYSLEVLEELSSLALRECR